MNDLIIGQILGIIATCLTCLSYQANTKRTLLAIQTAATAFTCISFLFLDAMTGFALNIVCIVRNIVFYFQNTRNKLFYISAAVMTLAMIGVGALSWDGPISLVLIIALAINTVFIAIGNPQLLRKSILLTCSMIIVYNVFVFSIGGIANESISIVSSIIGIIRYRNSSDTASM